MKRIALLAAVAALLAPPAASAQSGSTHTGSCRFLDHDLVDAVGSSADELLAVAVVAVRDAAGAPAGAEVTCELRINGWPADGASGSGTGVVVVAGTVQYAASATDRLTFCTVVDYADATPTATACVAPSQIPPDEPHVDPPVTPDELFVRYVDPLLCPVLAMLTLPPGFPVQVNNQGDVYVLGEPYWDCPPYDIWS
ncbi:MAG TPA: hypothetical protein VNA20_10905 [Frankiaceae bacterium]|nr:hypothetical protein [Frankiaceae bacterium]